MIYNEQPTPGSLNHILPTQFSSKLVSVTMMSTGNIVPKLNLKIQLGEKIYR